MRRQIDEFRYTCLAPIHIFGVVVHFDKDIECISKKKKTKSYFLLIGGDKSSQQKDIKKAKEIWNRIKDK